MRLHGTHIHLMAAGTGWFLLRGEGRYLINGENEGDWPDAQDQKAVLADAR